jgi:hypothetical protein
MVRRETRKNKVAEQSDYGVAQVHESKGMELSKGEHMNKKKRFVKRFINHLFSAYNAPR